MYVFLSIDDALLRTSTTLPNSLTRTPTIISLSFPTPQAAIDLDQAQLEIITADEEEEYEIGIAESIYESGANSHPYAALHLTNTLRFDAPVPAGTVVVGTGINGNETLGTLVWNAPVNATRIYVAYPVSDVRKNPTACRVRNVDSIELEACFAENGTVMVGSEAYSYTYDAIDDNKNAISLQDLSINAELHHKEGNLSLAEYDMFSMYTDFYQTADYADRIVAAGFAGYDAELSRGNVNFESVDKELAACKRNEQANGYVSHLPRPFPVPNSDRYQSHCRAEYLHDGSKSPQPRRGSVPLRCRWDRTIGQGRRLLHRIATELYLGWPPSLPGSRRNELVLQYARH